MKFLLILPALCFGWGERGHHIIARAAAVSVLERAKVPAGEEALYKNFRDFFRQKSIQLGHISNIPDTSWRSLDPLAKALNAPSHFSDSDMWTLNFDDIPLEYSAALKKFHGKPSLTDGKPVDFFETGTLYWRAQEFWELTKAGFLKAKAEQPGTPEFKAAVREALVNAGLLAHFIGDASMPYHNAADYDGYNAGNGGLHEYFETESLYHAPPEFEVAVHNGLSAQYVKFGVDEKIKKGGARAAAYVTREMGRHAYGKILEMQKLDDAFIIERSSVVDGKRKSAKRRPAEDAFPTFRPMITEQTAQSAAVLAALWRLAWEQGGKPDLSQGFFWDYTHKPDFVPPAYDPAAVERAKARLAAEKKP
jgi:hypothetical protein